MLKFGPDTVKQLERAYLGADFAARRRFNFDTLAPCPGEKIVDVGCGNGLLTQELSRTLGPEGRVTGVDQSPDMLAAAKARLSGETNVELIEAAAHAIPLADDSQDGAVSIQVFEYINDVEAAVAEVARILRPGGRAVIGDMHFDCWAWASDDPERMQRMMAAWDDHLVHRDAAVVVCEALPKTGLVLDRVLSLPMTDTALKPDGMAGMLMILMRDFAIERGAMAEDDANAWYDEQVERARAGRFFFSLTHFTVLARKP